MLCITDYGLRSMLELFSSQEYHLAGTHCYGRYLWSIGLGEEKEEGRGKKVAEYFQKMEERGLIVAAVSQLTVLPPARFDIPCCCGSSRCTYTSSI